MRVRERKNTSWRQMTLGKGSVVFGLCPFLSLVYSLFLLRRRCFGELFHLLLRVQPLGYARFQLVRAAGCGGVCRFQGAFREAGRGWRAKRVEFGGPFSLFETASAQGEPWPIIFRVRFGSGFGT